jgi:high-affinity iron transporter
MAVDVFSVPVFLVVFRETLETVIIVSVLLAFLKQTLDGPNRDLKVYKSLRLQVSRHPTQRPPKFRWLLTIASQVWLGTGLGFLICLIVAAALIGVFYKVGSNTWEQNEFYYEGAFSLFAAIIITIMGAALLRIGKMQEKWRGKPFPAVEDPIKIRGRGAVKRFFEKYAMFVLPFITVLREGVEAIIFVAGVTFSAPATAVPLPVIVGLLVGALAGYILYK